MQRKIVRKIVPPPIWSIWQLRSETVEKTQLEWPSVEETAENDARLMRQCVTRAAAVEKDQFRVSQPEMK